jgi:1-acyl-sn-glycerol-3-phosphate acyltransferase
MNFKFEHGKKYIIAANHPSRADPFLVCYSFPFKTFVKLIPFRFITADEYLRIPIVGQILLLYGCIPTKKTNKGKVLDRATQLLNKGETIFIFPKGELYKENKIQKPKVGVIYMEREVKSSKIIPVQISMPKGIFKKTTLHYKEAIGNHSHPEDLQPLADDLMKKIEQN